MRQMSVLQHLAATVVECSGPLCRWDDSGNVTVGTTAVGPRFLTEQGIVRIHHVARETAQEFPGSRNHKMSLQKFMATLACLFRSQGPSWTVYSLDILVCMLHDCHGVEIEQSCWEEFKRQVSLGIVPTVDERRALPMSETAGVSEFSRKRPMQVDAESESSQRSCQQRLSSDSDLCFGSSSSSVDGPSKDALVMQNKLLRELLSAKDVKIAEQRNTIKTVRQKASRAEKLAAQLARSLQNRKTKDQLFEPTRVKGEKTLQQQVRRLANGRLQQFLQHDDCFSDDDLDQEKKCGEPADKSMGWLTPHGSIALAIRRNVGNASAQDLGLIIMTDVSKQTVLRSECRTGAAFLANTRLFFEEWNHEDGNRDMDSCSFFFLQYREDATNASKHRQKMTALDIHASYAITDSTDDSLQSLQPCDFHSIRRLADVLPVFDGTGPGTMALTKKMLESLGCPSWDTFLSEWRDGATQQLGCRGQLSIGLTFRGLGLGRVT